MHDARAVEKMDRDDKHCFPQLVRLFEVGLEDPAFTKGHAPCHVARMCHVDEAL